MINQDQFIALLPQLRVPTRAPELLERHGPLLRATPEEDAHRVALHDAASNAPPPAMNAAGT